MKRSRYCISLLLALIAVLLWYSVGSPSRVSAAVQPFTTADISGTGSAVQLTAGAAQARWVLFIAGTSNTHAIRIGPASVTSTSGAPVVAGGGLLFPPIPTDQAQPNATNNMYQLSSIYALVQNGDTLSVVWSY